MAKKLDCKLQLFCGNHSAMPPHNSSQKSLCTAKKPWIMQNIDITVSWKAKPGKFRRTAWQKINWKLYLLIKLTIKLLAIFMSYCLRMLWWCVFFACLSSLECTHLFNLTFLPTTKKIPWKWERGDLAADLFSRRKCFHDFQSNLGAHSTLTEVSSLGCA